MDSVPNVMKTVHPNLPKARHSFKMNGANVLMYEDTRLRDVNGLSQLCIRLQRVTQCQLKGNNAC